MNEEEDKTKEHTDKFQAFLDKSRIDFNSTTKEARNSLKEFVEGMCGCGREGRYMITRDGKTVNSCNKRMRCPTYDEQVEHIKKLNEELSVYRNAAKGLTDLRLYLKEKHE